ncbi:MAG: sigma-54-dependent Fis family transcriptional regulator [Deltaproteobacteria bacterium]|nr:sigma-54-dependent Fis family transcriptional regulator [Deltaproteobacteria bacterium]MBW2648220.1 sigma-54-dependent Fis family transcriptional regulator [Deltaproteobacteria bacterium]
MNETILVVDDEESICLSLKGILSDEGYEVLTAQSGEECLDIIEEELPSLVLLDIWLPGIDGVETLKRIKSRYPQIQVIMISGHGTVESAVVTTKLGAFDFIEKPLSLDKIVLVVDHALDIIRLEEENKLLKNGQEHEIDGKSKIIVELKEMIQIISPTNAWILIMGENGTGKELVARSIHRQSSRSDKSFIEVNCAAIPEELIESELFGHEKGAFTGATEKKRGKFDLANKGTIFLDEVADMSLKAQAKILRILQEKKFERVGGTKIINTDVRVLAATNKDLEYEMEEGRFRQDLYYRLNVIPIQIPPLRDRIEDVPLLADHFIREFSLKESKKEKHIADDALAVLMEHTWPGNVRELKNIMERLVITSPSDIITADDIPPLSKENHKSRDSGFSEDVYSFKGAREIFEKDYLAKRLVENDWNVKKTAKSIGLERSNLHKKIKAYGLNEMKEKL